MKKFKIPEGKFTFAKLRQINPHFTPRTIQKFVTEALERRAIKQTSPKVFLKMHSLSFKPFTTDERLCCQEKLKSVLEQIWQQKARLKELQTESRRLMANLKRGGTKD